MYHLIVQQRFAKCLALAGVGDGLVYSVVQCLDGAGLYLVKQFQVRRVATPPTKVRSGTAGHRATASAARIDVSPCRVLLFMGTVMSKDEVGSMKDETRSSAFILSICGSK